MKFWLGCITALFVILSTILWQAKQVAHIQQTLDDMVQQHASDETLRRDILRTLDELRVASENGMMSRSMPESATRVSEAEPSEPDQTEHYLRDLKNLIPRIEQRLVAIDNHIAGIQSSTVYANRSWQEIVAAHKTPSVEDFKALQLGTPYYVAIEAVGLPKSMSGSYYNELQIRYPNSRDPANTRNDTVLVFGGGLLTTVIVDGITVNPPPPGG